MLQFNNLRVVVEAFENIRVEFAFLCFNKVDQRKEPCIRVNTRKLNKVLVQCIYLYILTTNSPCSTISSLP